MNITEVATKPQLEEVVLDDPLLIETYGEPLTFWMLDHININTYFDFYKFQGDQDGDALMTALRKIILNAEGKPAIGEDVVLPVDVTLSALTKINEHLGKSKAKLSKKEVGTPQE
jgi:hypothetical protein